jgi:hypothetical protein
MRLTSRVPPSAVGVNCHDHVESGLAQSSQRSTSNESTRNAVRSVGGGFGDIGTH